MESWLNSGTCYLQSVRVHHLLCDLPPCHQGWWVLPMQHVVPSSALSSLSRAQSHYRGWAQVDRAEDQQHWLVHDRYNTDIPAASLSHTVWCDTAMSYYAERLRPSENRSTTQPAAHGAPNQTSPRDWIRPNRYQFENFNISGLRKK